VSDSSPKKENCMAEATKPESTLRREADYAATQALKESHLAEFNALKVREMDARGIKWTPKPTEKEKAAEQFQKLLSENPDFASLVSGQAAPSPAPVDPA
jgi:hypothetical protein